MTALEHRTELDARLDDAIAKAEKGISAVIPFLTPRERRQAERTLRERGYLEQAFFFGGYPTAERACLFILPDYLLSCMEAPLEQATPEEIDNLLDGALFSAVSAIRITGSGYRVLTHRDYLGSLLGLGLERDALGDIAVQNDQEAVVFCSHTMRDFLLTSLEKVASDSVRCTPYYMESSFTDGRRYQPIRNTVASQRLDCVVAALTNLSREAAQSAIRSGSVEVEFEPEERVDHILCPPLTISIRGHGRFILRSFDGETRKGRLRLFGEKLI